MKILRQFAFGTFAMLFLASTATMSFAADPPSRVARLKYISGEVSMQPGGVNDWAAATINRPMTTADRLWTDKDSRAELHLGSAAMRMDGETSLTLSNLTDNTVQLELDQGTLNLQVARMFRGEVYEVDTPNMAFTLLKPGEYRFDVDSRGDATLVTVWQGRGVATGNGQAVRIDSHKQVRFMGGMSLAHATYNAPGLDGFDEWCRVRSERESHVVSARYVSADVVGYEDLDEYGSWRVVPSYGTVWFPTRVEAGWAPYRYGHWVWIEPWGWTWVDDAAWGFAPFHYGRWVVVTGSWAWVPGPVNVRPCYAPALVAWVGTSGAGVGWFPLGYGEPYIPSYHVSRGYFQTINVSNTRITNITYVTNNYYNVTNVHINNIHYINETTATTIVNNDVIVNSRRIDRDVFIDRDRDRHEDHDRWVMAGPPIPPSHRSVLGAHADQPAPMPPERTHERPVVVNIRPPERPVDFDRKYGVLESHRGQPQDNGDNDRMRKHMPVQTRPDAYGNGNARNYPDQNRDNRPSDDRRFDNRNPDDRERRDAVADQNRDNRPSDDRRLDNRSDDRDRRDGVADHNRDYPWNVPRPPRNGDDDRGQPTPAADNYPDPRQPARNPNAGNDDQRNANNGDWRQNGPRWNRPAQNDGSDGRNFPHPPGRDDNNGRAVSSGNNSPAPAQPVQDPSIANGQERNNSGDYSDRGGPRWGGSHRDDSSDARQVPHPPSSGNDDRGQATSAGGNAPAPKQPVQNPNVNNGDRQPNYGNARNMSNGDSRQRNDAGVEQQAQRPTMPMRPTPFPHPEPSPASNGADRNVAPAPAQQSEPMRGRPTPVPEQQAPQTSYRDRGPVAPPPQQAERPVPRSSSPQTENANSRPAAPAPRMAEPQHASQSDSHPATSKQSNPSSNAHGNAAFQEHDHGKPQDR